MPRLKEEDFAYATARIRSAENKLLTVQKLERLFEASSPAEAIRIVTEAGYGEGAAGGAVASEDLEKLLSSEMKKCFSLLKTVLPDSEAVELFMRRNDYLNAKILLKAEFSGVPGSQFLSDAGTVPPDKLSRMITDRNLKELPETFQNAILESIEAYGKTNDPQTVDFVLDRGMYTNMLEDAGRIDEPFVTGLVETLVDVANVRIFIRAKLLKKAPDFVIKALIPGGRPDIKTYAELIEKPFEAFLAALRYADLLKLSESLKELVKGNVSMSAVEKALDDYVIEEVRKSRRIAMGIEPAVAYLFYKETEIRNVRLIITGKVNKLPHESIRERVRISYA